MAAEEDILKGIGLLVLLWCGFDPWSRNLCMPGMQRRQGVGQV